MSSLSTSTQIYLYQSSDLDNYAENYDKTKARAFCPVHGSDKQRSLNVDLTGENRGFAHCHNCHAVILLEDLNREAAQRIREKDEREQKGLIKPAPIRIRTDPKPRKQTPEQSYDLPLLKKYHADMQRALSYERPSAYLKQRGIPLDDAVAQGLLYLPVIPARKQTPELKKLRAWYDHIIFPLSSTAGQGFIGRNLHLWTPGMDEKEHRDLLKAPETPIPPYMKTKPAGYFRFEIPKECEQITIVEGPFDALSCLLAGVHDVVGLGGVALDVKMLPRSVQRVRIALDNDVTGREKAEILKKNLLNFGIDATIVVIPDDGRSEKDWNERWKLYGKSGLEVLLRGTEGLVPLTSAAKVEEPPTTCCMCGSGVERYSDTGTAYCSRHFPRQHTSSFSSQEQFVEAVGKIASALPGEWAVHVDRARVLESKAIEPDFWQILAEKLAKSGYYERFAKDNVIDSERFAHYPGGYGGYCKTHTHGEQSQF